MIYYNPHELPCPVAIATEGKAYGMGILVFVHIQGSDVICKATIVWTFKRITNKD